MKRTDCDCFKDEDDLKAWVTARANYTFRIGDLWNEVPLLFPGRSLRERVGMVRLLYRLEEMFVNQFKRERGEK